MATNKRRICRVCNLEKDLDTGFGTNSQCLDKKQTRCKECHNIEKNKWRDNNREYIREYNNKKYTNPEYRAKLKEYYAANKDRSREHHLKYNYGITLEDFNKLFTEQEGACAVCNIHQSELSKTLSVDHCHSSGNIRGLLCSNCNTALGLLKDSSKNIESLLSYLERNNGD